MKQLRPNRYLPFSLFWLIYPTLSSVVRMRWVVLTGISRWAAMVLMLSSYCSSVKRLRTVAALTMD